MRRKAECKPAPRVTRKRRRTDLSGFALHQYLKGVVRREPGLAPAARTRLVSLLEAEIASLRLRRSIEYDADAATPAKSCAGAGIETAAPFDPFTPNVVVVLRTQGAPATMAALLALGDAGLLQALAREQRLTIDEDLDGIEAIAAAIVTAASRRISNRRAAAS